jgi:cobalamin biosynthesis protein CobT
VYLLVDGSGSMAGRDRYECATAAAMAMADSLTPLQMPVKVAIFSDDYSRVIHAVVKGWGDRYTPEQMKQRFQKFRLRGMMRNNDDGSSVLHAAKDLATRKEHRKILIVLSDGQPAASGAGDAYTYAEKVIKAVSQQVDCYGIGIQDKTVSHLYPESTCITNPSQLNDALLSVVKQKLL